MKHRTLESVLRLAPVTPSDNQPRPALCLTGEYKRAEDFLARANTLQPQTFDILSAWRLSLLLETSRRSRQCFELLSTLNDCRRALLLLGLIASARGQDEVAANCGKKR